MPFNDHPVYRPICQVQREILFFAERLPECSGKYEIIDRVNEALRMAKRMDARLKKVAPGYNKVEWRKDYSQGDVFKSYIPGSRKNVG